MAKEYKSKFGGGKIDALLNHLDEGLSQGKDLSTNDYTAEDKSLVEGIPNKANKKGYYKDMSVGMADNLVGRGDVQDAHINFRPSAGADNITDGAARIERIKGNSVVYNQLRKDNIGGNAYSFNVARQGRVYTFSNAFDSYAKIAIGNTAILGHKYLLRCNVVANDYSLATITSNTTQMQSDALKLPTSGWAEVIVTKKINATNNAWHFQIYDEDYATKSATLEDLQIIDLTKEFGAKVANNITSYEDYLRLKPMNIEDEFAHNDGELIDMKVDSLVSIGDNLFDKSSWQRGIMSNDGVFTPNSAANKGCVLLKCIPNTLYYGVDFSNGYVVAPLWFYDEQMNFIKHAYVGTTSDLNVHNAKGLITSPNNAHYMRILCFEKYLDTCSVSLVHSGYKADNYKYFPYQKEVKDLSFIGEAFPEGMRSAGSAFDEIRFNPTKKVWEAVKKIGEVDLGNLNWVASSTAVSGVYRLFTQIPSDAKGITTNQAKANILSPKYTTSVYDDVYNVVGDLIVSLAANSTIQILDKAYTNGNTFKQAMQEQGVKLYYELAEPIVVELDYPIAETNMDYMAWDFGTEEAIATEPSAPFRADIVYDFNATDDIRSLSTKVTTLETKVNGKQDKISVTTKSNGNIVLLGKEFMPATPSGDPQHYAYEAAGAVWNATTGYWELNELTDITNAEMCAIYAERYPSLGGNVLTMWWRNSIQRTNLCACRWGQKVNVSIPFGGATRMVTATLVAPGVAEAMLGAVDNVFRSCYSLRSVISVMNMSYASTITDIFYQCRELVEVRLKELKANISFADSPLLSKESLLYMINNSASDATFTITLHPDVYAKCTDSEGGAWYDDIVNAIDMAINSKDTRITLASA